MAIRRTQEQKERAAARRIQVIEEKLLSIELEDDVAPKPLATAQRSASRSVSDILHTDVSLLKKDLVRSSIITILLLGCIFGIFIYLR
jgi:hypothetical protein